MKRIGFLLKVRQDKVEEYKKHHENVWPEMQEALRRSGWHKTGFRSFVEGLTQVSSKPVGTWNRQ